MRVVITAGYERSLHASALIQMVDRSELDLVGAISVSINRKRALAYARQLGGGRAAKRLVSRYASGYRATANLEVLPMREYSEANDIESSTVSEAAAKAGVEARSVPSLDAPDALAWLASLKPDLVLYAGGGILRQPFLDIPTVGVLNAHAGPLPFHRGMNSSEWALLDGKRPVITTIMVDRGVDTGPIVAEHEIAGQPARSIAHLRGLATVASMKALLTDAQRLADGTIEPSAQAADDGRQHFVMAAPMVALLDEALERGTHGS